MKKHMLTAAMGAFTLVATAAFGADVNRHISIELDPLSPAAAARESSEGDPTSMFGAGVDFNLGQISTGPEVWTGTFVRKGPTGDCGTALRSQSFAIGELQCGDRFKTDAVRLRWTVGLWESTYTMRGLFVKGGYSYTKIQSKDTRGNSIDGALRGVEAEPTTTDVVDMRQGAVGIIGQRWAFWDHTGTVTLSMSYTANFKRTVTVDGAGDLELARADYDNMIENIQDSKISARAMPEFNLGFGYLW